MLVLVADYLRAGPTELDIRLPVKSRCTVTDLDTREKVGEISAYERLTVLLHLERARLLHVKPETHAQR